MKIPGANTFKLANFQYYTGFNPYLDTGAVVFDFTLLPEARPLPLASYQEQIAQFLPDLAGIELTNYGDLLGQTLTRLSRLEMNLHWCDFSISKTTQVKRIALQSLHYPTSKAIVETVWQWLEAITAGETFDYYHNLTLLQEKFRDSIYGDPTVYALLSTAYQLDIPYFFIWEEGLMQYGYGKFQIRGLSTIFSTDSLLDSDLTTQKDDCKDFLAHLGFPVPQGRIVDSLEDALASAAEIGYPVAIKPVAGHEGMGVTAQVRDKEGLIDAFTEAQSFVNTPQSAIIVEESLQGSDFRLLCIGQEFTAALERRPPYVVGDGKLTIAELIAQENQTEARQDTPTSALTKIKLDEALQSCLAEQNLSLETVIASQQIVYLRKVANISAGGVSIDVTDSIHPDNRILAEDIAQYLGLACLGIDVITPDISESWKRGNFGIIEINASPGVFMHLKPAQGKSIDVPRQIFHFFKSNNLLGHLPIVTFDYLEPEQIRYIVKEILDIYPQFLVGASCSKGIWLNDRERLIQKPYNSNIQSLLRHPGLGLLIAEYTDINFQAEGLFYEKSDLVILQESSGETNPLADSLASQGVLLKKKPDILLKKTSKTQEEHRVTSQENYWRICLEAIIELIIDPT